MTRIVAENGVVVTDEMIAGWESALERDEWPSDWDNVGEVVEGRLLETTKQALEDKALRDGRTFTIQEKSTSDR